MQAFSSLIDFCCLIRYWWRCTTNRLSNLIQRHRETERDRERQRETERDRERQRETERDRERQRETERDRERQSQTDTDE